MKLLGNSSVDPVFHVSLLKKSIGNAHVISYLPSDNPTLQVPEMVLDSRLKDKGRQVIRQVLIKWMGCPMELATWEDEDQVCLKKPTGTACGQAVFQDRRNVTDYDQLAGKEERVTRRKEGQHLLRWAGMGEALMLIRPM